MGANSDFLSTIAVRLRQFEHLTHLEIPLFDPRNDNGWQELCHLRRLTHLTIRQNHSWVPEEAVTSLTSMRGLKHLTLIGEFSYQASRVKRISDYFGSACSWRQVQCPWSEPDCLPLP